MSVGVRAMREPMENPLLRIERWVRQAAFGALVVPDVNCIFTMSSRWSSASGTTLSFREVEPKRSVKGVVERKGEVSIRPWELSTSIMLRREGTDADPNSEADRSGTMVLRSVIFSLGGLYGKFVSVPIIRWVASRWESAEMTCGALKAGFRGTCSLCQLLPSSTSPPSFSPFNIPIS